MNELKLYISTVKDIIVYLKNIIFYKSKVSLVIIGWIYL